MDLVFLFSIIILGLVGFIRGFFKEILGLISFVGAICLSIALNKTIVNKTLFMIEEPLISSTIAYILSFLILIFLLMIFNFIIIKIFKLENNSIFTKIFGGLVGIFKAYIFCLLIYFVVYSFVILTKNDEMETENNLQKMERILPKFFTKSKTFPLFFESIDKIDKLFQAFFGKNNLKIENKKKNSIEEKSDEKKNEILNKITEDQKEKELSENNVGQKIAKNENEENKTQDENKDSSNQQENSIQINQNQEQQNQDSFVNLNQELNKVLN